MNETTTNTPNLIELIKELKHLKRLHGISDNSFSMQGFGYDKGMDDAIERIEGLIKGGKK